MSAERGGSERFSRYTTSYHICRVHTLGVADARLVLEGGKRYHTYSHNIIISGSDVSRPL